MPLNLYLSFGGNCRQAFEFYQAALGGDLELMTYADAPADMQVPASAKDKIMHASLPIGDSVLMGSDNNPQSPPLTVGNNFSISVSAETGDRPRCDELLAKLSSGGSVTMPMQETFWGAYFGTCIDKFAVNWMVSCELSSG